MATDRGCWLLAQTSRRLGACMASAGCPGASVLSANGVLCSCRGHGCRVQLPRRGSERPPGKTQLLRQLCAARNREADMVAAALV